MPIVDGNFDTLDADDIQALLEQELVARFGADVDLSESSVFSTFLRVFAEVNSENIENDLAEVYNAAFIDTATGLDLEKVVAILGIVRRSATHATGTVVFSRETPASKDYIVSNGSEIQTESDTPTVFTTQEPVTIEFYDGFEDGNLNEYSGDLGAASINTAHSTTGNNSLQMNGTADATIHRTDLLTSPGDTLHVRNRVENGAIADTLFGTQDASNTYFVRVDETSGAFELRKEVGGVETLIADDQLGSGNIPNGEYLWIDIDWRLPDENDDTQIVCTLQNAAETQLSQITGSVNVDTDFFEGGMGFRGVDATANKFWDDYTSSATAAKVRANVGGTGGNSGANTLTVLPLVPSGVDDVTNPFPTGNSSYLTTDQTLQTTGEEREDDDALRQRAQTAVAAGGDATVEAIASELINTVDEVRSVSIFENETDADNTGTGGLPPHSFEVVVFGGLDDEVAQAIFNKKGVTARDYAGVNGTADSGVATSESTGQQFTMEFSRPTALNVDLTLDLVVDDTYVGDDEIRDDIVDYIGGVQSDSTDEIGLGVGQDVLADKIEDIVVGDEQGVIGIVSLSTTPALTTDSNGLEVVAVGADEVAQTDATDGSITITTTQV